MANLNSLEAFTRSIRRAANFRSLQPIIPTRLLNDEEQQQQQQQQITPTHRHRQHEEVPVEQQTDEAAAERDDSQFPGKMRDLHDHSDQDVQAGHSEESPLLGANNGKTQPSTTDESGFVPLRSKLNDPARRRVQELSQARENSRAAEQKKDDHGGKDHQEEREPLLVQRILRDDDGTWTEIILGQSTLPQTIFNSSNVLIGVGMLSLPLGIRYAGWVIGLTFLLFSALVTKYTASLLAKCLDVDSSLANFADIAFVAYGEPGRLATSALFTLELTAACISLVVLFADSLKTLVDGMTDVQGKVLCGCIFAPLNFLPMRWLSLTSFLGVFCGIGLIGCTILAGVLKPTSPGSLLQTATTTAFPEQWRALPLSFGLIMAVWGGHSVFPNIYRDMRHPQKYEHGLKLIFGFVTSVDLVMAIIGYLMYGRRTKDEISTNLLTVQEYPEALHVVVLILVAIIPLTKFPLNCSPIISTLEVLSRIDPRAASVKPNRFNQSTFLTKTLRAVFRIGVTCTIVLLAILVPSFEVISAIMGAAFCFLICVILPVMFHLKMFGREISRREMLCNWALIIGSAILGIAGTVWEFLPKEWMGLGKVH
ncbi:vacuolar amino acid transporter-like protein 1 [Hortaea werneckii]|nr:vacuolar amino acid transporter-like protein 1 [Hortaea werneckii]